MALNIVSLILVLCLTDVTMAGIKEVEMRYAVWEQEKRYLQER